MNTSINMDSERKQFWTVLSGLFLKYIPSFYNLKRDNTHL